MIVLLYCLGENSKKKCLYMFSTNVIFFPNVFNAWLDEFEDTESVNTGG